jgi:hypothetical protein
MDPQLRTLDSRLRGNDGLGWTFDSSCSHDRRRRTADENWGSLRVLSIDTRPEELLESACFG